MSNIVLSKEVKIVSVGRYQIIGWVAVGPQRFLAKKSVADIKRMLDKYPSIQIVERTPNGKLVYLNQLNYNKNNDVDTEKTVIAGGDETPTTDNPEYQEGCDDETDTTELTGDIFADDTDESPFSNEGENTETSANNEELTTNPESNVDAPESKEASTGTAEAVSESNSEGSDDEISVEEILQNTATTSDTEAQTPVTTTGAQGQYDNSGKQKNKNKNKGKNNNPNQNNTAQVNQVAPTEPTAVTPVEI